MQSQPPSVIKSDQSGDAKSLEQVIRREEEGRAQYLAKKLSLRYVNLLTFPVESDVLAIMDEEDARSAKMALLQKRGKKLIAGCYDPTMSSTELQINRLREQLYEVDLVVVSETSLEKAWEYYKTIEQAKKLKKHIAGKVDIDPRRLGEHRSKMGKGIPQLAAYLSGIPESRVSDLVEAVIAGALETAASDIHFEAEEKQTRVRYRIDGILQDVMYFSLKNYALILSRLKLLSGLKINLRDVAQDGRFSIAVEAESASAEGAAIEVRTSILPGPYGENVVMRVLNPLTIAATLDDLGMRKEMYAIVLDQLKRTNGMILTTGPTGSGKTTTLYAFIKKIDEPGVKIITIEDPIEYHITGIEQTQVAPDKGYTFATGLRAIIRQDPDVILVGEIRDFETADIAMHSALTGHLVFATLHTNDAAGAIPRLINMGVTPVVIAPAINVVIAQRLVRKICSQCVAWEAPSPQLLALAEKTLRGLAPTVHVPVIDATARIAKPVGCDACNGTGFHGRTGIFEAFLVDDAMEQFILQAPTVSDIHERAASLGMITMFQDGILKIFEGMTTIDEVERVVG